MYRRRRGRKSFNRGRRRRGGRRGGRRRSTYIMSRGGIQL